MTMPTRVEFPTYETLLAEAIRSLAVDSGTVTAPAPIGTNVLNDATKNWATNVHKNRLVKIVRGAGAGQMAVIESNSAKSLLIKQSWTVALDTTSVYVILGVDIVSEFTALKEALSRVLEVSEDSGTATGGSNTTVVDTSKNWAVNMWANAVVHVIHAGIEYVRLCSANTADTLTIAALPAGVNVTAGDPYAIRRPITIADISDRAARLLGIVDSLTKWGGTALTGRDISLDLANLTKLIPIAKAAIFNTALPAAEANWLGADITSTNSPSYLRLYVAVATAGILRIARTVGGVTVTENLNSGNNLVANAAYMFDVEWRSGDSLNFRYSVTGANIVVFRADEIGGAA